MSMNQSKKQQTTTTANEESHIRVYSTALLDDLLSAAEYSPPQETLSEASREEDERNKADFARDQIKSMQKMREEEFQRQFEKAKRDAERRLKEARKRREQKFQEMWTGLMDEKNGLLQDIDDYLRASDASNQRQREELYRRWCEQVFDPIQAQIQTQLASLSVEEIEARRLAMFEKFLQASNRKDLFRDIIIESEYDPLEPRREHTIKYTGGGAGSGGSSGGEGVSPPKRVAPVYHRPQFADPTAKPGVREMMDIRVWTRPEATPHGHFSHEDPDAPPKSKPDPIRQSHVMFDHYSYPRGREPTSAEIPRGKKVYPEWKPTGKSHEPIL